MIPPPNYITWQSNQSRRCHSEEARETGDGGDSDDEADNFLDHNAAMVEAIVERQEGTEGEEVVDDSDWNYVAFVELWLKY
jgi:hypothetical protein